MKKINLSPGARRGILFLNGFAAVGSVFLTLLQLFTNGAANEIQAEDMAEETLEMLDQRYERKALPEKTEDEDQEEES